MSRSLSSIVWRLTSTSSSSYYATSTALGKKTYADIVKRREKFRFIYPEFLPNPDPEFRNLLVEKLERRDMMARREVVDLPEFYVGSIVAVTAADPNSPNVNRQTRFLGICIARWGSGLRAKFTLRNAGLEFTYQLYSPTVLKVETIRLERRLDDELFYLRNAPSEFSTFPADMEPEILPEGAFVPINETVVPLNPKSTWLANWHQLTDRFRGYEMTEDMWTPTEEQMAIPSYRQKYKKDKLHKGYLRKGWQDDVRQFDILLHYRKAISIEEQDAIWAEVGDRLEERDREMRKVAAKKAYQKPAPALESSRADAIEKPDWWGEYSKTVGASKSFRDKKRMKKWQEAEKMMGVAGKMFEKSDKGNDK